MSRIVNNSEIQAEEKEWCTMNVWIVRFQFAFNVLLYICMYLGRIIREIIFSVFFFCRRFDFSIEQQSTELHIFISTNLRLDVVVVVVVIFNDKMLHSHGNSFKCTHIHPYKIYIRQQSITRKHFSRRIAFIGCYGRRCCCRHPHFISIRRGLLCVFHETIQNII